MDRISRAEWKISRQRMVPQWCIGSREAFDLVKMMIEYKIRTLKVLETVKDESEKAELSAAESKPMVPALLIQMVLNRVEITPCHHGMDQEG